MLPVFPCKGICHPDGEMLLPNFLTKYLHPFLTTPECTLGKKIGAIRQCIGYNYSKIWNYLHTNARARI